MIDGALPPTAPDSGHQREMVPRLLATVRQHFSMDAAWVALFAGELQTTEWVDVAPSQPLTIRAGDTSSIRDTVCGRVALGLLPPCVPDTDAEPLTRSQPLVRSLGIGSYVTTAIRDENAAVIGMVCCASHDRSDHLGDDAERVLSLVSELIREGATGSDAWSRHATRVHERVARTIAEQRFHPVFQPVFNLRTRTVVGVEALTRFDEPPGRPDAWFADAASVGLGVELEVATLGLALASLPDLPEDLYLAVNASPGLIDDPRLLEAVTASDARRIVLEITEHAEIQDYARLVRSLERLRQVGVRISVDDLGAGFSSFSHVLELSPNILKLDVSIVRGIDTDSARQALAGAVVEMARQLGADLVAEGVETYAELRVAAGIGITSVQGYLVARPGPLPVAEVVLDEPLDLESGRRAGVTIEPRQFDLLMRHSPIGVCIVGLDGRFQKVNPALAAMFHYRPQELLELTFQELTHPDDLSTDLRLVDQCIAGSRTSYRIEKRYLRADGIHIRGDLTVVLVRTASGTPQCFISQIVDLGPDDTWSAERTEQGPAGLPGAASG